MRTPFFGSGWRRCVQKNILRSCLPSSRCCLAAPEPFGRRARCEQAWRTLVQRLDTLEPSHASCSSREEMQRRVRATHGKPAHLEKGLDINWRPLLMAAQMPHDSGSEWRISMSWDALFPAYSDASRLGQPRSFDPLPVRSANVLPAGLCLREGANAANACHTTRAQH